MDIPALSMAMTSMKVSSAASISVMKMSMDTMEETGQQLSQMMEGCTVDIKV